MPESPHYPVHKVRYSAKKIVDEAYVICKPELEEWKKTQEPLPAEMKQRMHKELYDFYIRMIEKRRDYETSKSAEVTH